LTEKTGGAEEEKNLVGQKEKVRPPNLQGFKKRVLGRFAARYSWTGIRFLGAVQLWEALKRLSEGSRGGPDAYCVPNKRLSFLVFEHAQLVKIALGL